MIFSENPWGSSESCSGIAGTCASHLFAGRHMMEKNLLADKRLVCIQFAWPRSWRDAAAFLLFFALAAAFARPTAAATPPGGALNSTHSILNWVHPYPPNPAPAPPPPPLPRLRHT